MKMTIPLLAVASLFISTGAIARVSLGYHSYSYTPRTYNPHSYTPRTYTPRSYTGEHYTSGYTRQNGTPVQGYHATNPNDTKSDNWSTRGNINPYTGKPGTKNPY